MRLVQISCVLAGLVAGCGSDDDRGPSIPTVFGGDRPVALQFPVLLEGRTYPLVLILHGYGASGFVQQAYFGMRDLAARHDVFVLAPDGLVDSSGRQFWHADDACCDFDGRRPDDVAYLGGLIDEVSAVWPVDPARVRVIGHSNGGFMAYRLACDRADVVTSIVGLAGLAVQPPCAPAQPVHVLHLHGTDDAVVPFAGAGPSVDQWATRNGCTGSRGVARTLDLDFAVAGSETSVEVTDGCPTGGEVELWTMEASSHVPNLTGAFDTAIRAWWADHPRP
jgi:polyhydroxybutyrate depolymerase